MTNTIKHSVIILSNPSFTAVYLWRPTFTLRNCNVSIHFNLSNVLQGFYTFFLVLSVRSIARRPYFKFITVNVAVISLVVISLDFVRKKHTVDVKSDRLVKVQFRPV